MSLWWLKQGWTSARCSCGAKIWPEGDPDWGQCYSCFTESHLQQYQEPQYKAPRCDICGAGEACANVGNFSVCSQECHDIALAQKETQK